jgi:uncharacterized protein YjiS (DUF1127 family)
MLTHSELRELKGHRQQGSWLERLLRRWRSLIETRRALRRLSAADDHILKDIGVSRGDIEWLVRHGRPRAKIKHE